MARGRSRGNRRQFAWYRSQGGQELLAEGGNLYGQVDLLDQVRAQYGQDVGSGSTVVAVKGYVKPNTAGGVANPSNLAGVVGVRACTRNDITSPNVDESPIHEIQQEASWMYYNPFHVSIPTTDLPPSATVASSAPGSNLWLVDAQSSRRIPQLSNTLGLFVGIYGEPPGTTVYFDYHLSVGVKLP